MGLSDVLGLGVRFFAKDEASGVFRQVGGNFQRLLGISEQASARMGAAFQNFSNKAMVGGALVATGAGIAYAGIKQFGAIKGTIDDAVKWETKMTEIGKLLPQQYKGLSNYNDILQQYDKDLTKAARATHQDINAVRDMTTNWLALGYAGEDAIKMTQSAARSSTLLGVSTEDAAGAMLSMKTAYKVNIESIKEYEKALGVINKMGDDTALEGKDAMRLLQFSATGASLQANTSMKGLLAMGAAARKGNQDITDFSYAINYMTQNTEKTQETFKGLGIEMRDAKGTLKPLDVAFGELRDKWSSLTAEQKETIPSELGKRYARVIGPMMENWDEYKRALASVGDEQANLTALQKEWNRVTKTAEVAQRNMKREWQLVKEAIGKALLPAFTKIVNVVTKVIEAIAKFAANHPGIMKIAGAVAVAAAAFTTLVGTVVALSGAFIIAKAGLQVFKAVLLGVGKSFLAALGPIALVAAAIGLLYYAWKKNLFGIKTGVTKFVKGLKSSFNDASKIMKMNSEEMKKSLQGLQKQAADGSPWAKLTLFMTKAGVAFNGLAEGWSTNGLVTEETLKKMQTAGVDGIVKQLLKVKIAVEGFFEGIWEPVKQALSELKSSMQGLGQTMSGFTGVDMTAYKPPPFEKWKKDAKGVNSSLSNTEAIKKYNAEVKKGHEQHILKQKEAWKQVGQAVGGVLADVIKMADAVVKMLDALEKFNKKFGGKESIVKKTAKEAFNPFKIIPGYDQMKVGLDAYKKIKKMQSDAPKGKSNAKSSTNFGDVGVKMFKRGLETTFPTIAAVSKAVDLMGKKVETSSKSGTAGANAAFQTMPGAFNNAVSPMESRFKKFQALLKTPIVLSIAMSGGGMGIGMIPSLLRKRKQLGGFSSINKRTDDGTNIYGETGPEFVMPTKTGAQNSISRQLALAMKQTGAMSPGASKASGGVTVTISSGAFQINVQQATPEEAKRFAGFIMEELKNKIKTTRVANYEAG